MNQHLIVLFSFVGGYSTSMNVFDLCVMIFVWLLGYVPRKVSYEPALVILTFMFRPMLERNSRQGLILSNGNLGVFLNRLLSAASLLISLLLLPQVLFHSYKGRELP
jgi:putative tricarboxylic transport membrane protein